MKLTVSQGGVPPGSHIALFQSTEATTNDLGDCLRWWFEIESGPHAGSRVGCITARKPTLKNSCGKILSGIVGKTLTNDMEVDLAPYVGKPNCGIGWRNSSSSSTPLTARTTKTLTSPSKRLNFRKTCGRNGLRQISPQNAESWKSCV